MNVAPTQAPAAPIVNYTSHVRELNERFGRLVKQLGTNNKRGSPRHEFEVNFSYALNEIDRCPNYLQGKMFDKASTLVNNLIATIKQQKEAAAATEAA